MKVWKFLDIKIWYIKKKNNLNQDLSCGEAAPISSLAWEIHWYFSSKFIKSYDLRYNVLSVLARLKNHLIHFGYGGRNITDIFSSVNLAWKT